MTPEPPQAAPRPTCRACEYDLSGLGVDDVCPECGSKIWVPHLMQPTSGYAITSLVLGCLAIMPCVEFGPLAVLFALPGVTFGHTSTAQVRLGTHGGATRGLAIVGLILSYIGLSLGLLDLLAMLVVTSR